MLFAIFLETGRDFGAAAPLKRPLVNLEILRGAFAFCTNPQKEFGDLLASYQDALTYFALPPFSNRHELMRRMGD